MDCIQNAALAAVEFARYTPVTSSITGLSLVIYGIAKATLNYFAEWHAAEGNKLTDQNFKIYRHERALGLEYAKMGCIEFIPFGKIVHACLYPSETEPKISPEVKAEDFLSNEDISPRERGQTQNSSYFVQVMRDYSDLEAKELRREGVEEEVIRKGILESFFTNVMPSREAFYATRFDRSSTEELQRLTQIIEKNPGELLYTSIYNIYCRTGDKMGDVCMYYNFTSEEDLNETLCMVINTKKDKCHLLPIYDDELIKKEDLIYLKNEYNNLLQFEENLSAEFETIESNESSF
ncbi:MAG: hypothetical protein H0T62_13425 [Parachlamydiaceae bacterium]|nr:hypothetical protein [Parachlamydiaceae bacterium]